MTPSPNREFALIDWIRSRAASAGHVRIGIGDDAAALDLANGGDVIVTADMLLDGMHFESAGTPPRAIGRKALACSLSDVAAMAALPRAAIVSVALPHDWPNRIAHELTAGLLELADRFDCPLVGGDVTSWDQALAISVTVLATESGVPAVRRSGARPGDAILVTGELGGSLPSGRHLTFEPRVVEARALAAAVELHAMIDLSDGLSSDLGHICDESGAGCLIEAAALPLSDAVRAADAPVAAALGDGEDFELCFTCPAADAERLLADPPIDTPLTRIGKIVAGPDRTLRLADGTTAPLPPTGYEHG